MFCSTCGSQIREGSGFCSGCGASMPGNQLYNNSQSYSQPPSYPQAPSYPQPPYSQQGAAAQPAPVPQPYSTVNNSNVQRPMVIVAPKSVGTAILLSFFFGPLGMLYSTVTGGLIMLVVTPILAFITLGFGLLITHPICVIWAAVAANSHNEKISRYAQWGQ